MILGCSLGLGGCVAPGGVARLVDDPGVQPATVQTRDGVLVGAASPWGKAWLGVPYAAPPVGPLRWRAPQPVTAWSAPRPSVRLGGDCLQNLSPRSLLGRPGGAFVRGREDCLVLNVYAPSNAVAGESWPVMVWLHGGGFVAGTAANYDPSLLAQRQGVIVVTLNYRLGVFGFLALSALSAEDPAAGSGDYGLLDQQAALRWVQANIAAFGGDPRRVTLFGQSAGGFSVCHQLTSPGATGLFQGATIQSGACTSPAQNIPLADAEAAGALTARDLGCQDAASRLSCLRAAPAGRLARTVSHRLGALGANSWGAVVGTPVLPLAMPQAFATGRFAHVPVILGSNRDEGRLFAVLQRLAGRLWTPENYKAVIRQGYGAAADHVLARYPLTGAATPATAYAEVVTDQVFACPTDALAELLGRRVPAYAYEFADAHAPYAFPNPPGLPELRAYHGSEIAYVLQRRWILADPARFKASQRRLSDLMQNAWGRFARRGDPNSLTADEAQGATRLIWPRHAPGDPVVLELQPDGAAPIHDYAAAHRCRFWRALGY